MRSVSFSDAGLRDRDIIFRDERDLAFCFLGCVVKFPTREANSWRRKARSNPGNRVCISFSFFPFLPFWRFFFTIKLTHSHKQGRCEDTRKGRKETESSSLHSLSGYFLKGQNFFVCPHLTKRKNDNPPPA